MAYTRHGHHIPGTTFLPEDERPKDAIECGVFRDCSECVSEGDSLLGKVWPKYRKQYLEEDLLNESYTSHGHHIPGLPHVPATDRPSPKRCGGLRSCGLCTSEATRVLALRAKTVTVDGAPIMIPFNDPRVEKLLAEIKEQDTSPSILHLATETARKKFFAEDLETEAGQSPGQVPQNRPDDFPSLAKEYVRTVLDKWYRENNPDEELPAYEVYVVTFAYILGGWKASLGTTMQDGRYFEVTYDYAQKQAYVDWYIKYSNTVIRDGEYSKS